MQALLIGIAVLAGLSAFALLYLARPLDGYPYAVAGKLYDLGKASHRKPLSEVAPHRLKIMTWNISYAYGVGSEAGSFTPRPQEAFEERLQRIAGVIRGADPDLVLLQEVDFRSGRSHEKDQLAELKRAGEFPYAAAAVSWSARYVPYPPWPIGRQVGSVASGGGILSRVPFADHAVVYHPRPESNPFWYNAFYLQRYTQVAAVQAFGQTFAVLNSHLEDTDAKARGKSVDALLKLVASSSPPVLVAAGDFNATPSEEAIQTLRRAPQLQDAFFAGAASDPDLGGWTFPSPAPDRRLDHVFVRRGIKVEAVEVVRAGDVSDHLPVMVTVVIPSAP